MDATSALKAGGTAGQPQQTSDSAMDALKSSRALATLRKTRCTTFYSSATGIKGQILSPTQSNLLPGLAAHRANLDGAHLAKVAQSIRNSALSEVRTKDVQLGEQNLSFTEFRQLVLSYDVPLTNDLFKNSQAGSTANTYGDIHRNIKAEFVSAVNLFRAAPRAFMAVIEERLHDPEVDTQKRFKSVLGNDLQLELNERVAQEDLANNLASWERSVSKMEQLLGDRTSLPPFVMSSNLNKSAGRVATDIASSTRFKHSDLTVMENIGHGGTVLQMIEEFATDFGEANLEKKGHLALLLDDFVSKTGKPTKIGFGAAIELPEIRAVGQADSQIYRPSDIITCMHVQTPKK